MAVPGLKFGASMATSDEIERRYWLSFVEQIIADATTGKAAEVLFRPDKIRPFEDQL